MILALLFGCVVAPTRTSPKSTTDTGAPEDTGTAPTDTTTELPPPPCPDGPGSACDPFPIRAFPYDDRQDTRDSTNVDVSAYGCSPDTDEGGAEYWYVVTLTETGLLSAAIDEREGDDVDIDVHLLSGPDPARDCVDRDHVGVADVLEPGTYFLVLDTFVSGGAEQAGPYHLTVTFRPLEGGACAVTPTDVEMYWSSCAGSVPGCFEQGGRVYLATPTVGPVVKEAHLVTTADGFGAGWPSSFTDGIAAHYANSEAASGYAMARTEPWAPAGEGGSEYGQGAYGSKLPPADEAWYLNMYWRQRPSPGTRLIVKNPANGRAVVAAGGYETGPGDPEHVAGVAEEVHDWLGTGHLDELEIGFATDQGLPLGPISCDP